MTTQAVAPPSRVTPVVPNVLYHYTCTEHGADGIRNDHKVHPYPQPFLGYPLVWLTDLELPDAWALGLTSKLLCCDRTEVRVSVSTHDGEGQTRVEPWWYYARRHVVRTIRDLYEDAGMPLHWWVCPVSVPATAMVATSVLRSTHPTGVADHG